MQRDAPFADRPSSMLEEEEGEEEFGPSMRRLVGQGAQ